MMFTFLTAIKNGFSDFRKTVPTVLAQTLADFEWVIVDDASSIPLTEAFPDLVRDPRVRILRNEAGLGQTISLNRGIRDARGDWIVRMDGDDLCDEARLAWIRDLLALTPAAQIVFSDYRVIDGDDREWAMVRYRSPLSDAFFQYLDLRNNPICHPTAAFRREKPDGTLRLFREDLVNAQDYALWKTILAEHGPAGFVHVPRPTVSYRIVRDSLSGARAKEQIVERNAIRDGHVLRRGEQARPTLSEGQKTAMQCYRLLYYRFVGEAGLARFTEDVALLRGTLLMPGLASKALFYLLLRPLRKVLLRRLFAGIYG